MRVARHLLRAASIAAVLIGSTATVASTAGAAATNDREPLCFSSDIRAKSVDPNAPAVALDVVIGTMRREGKSQSDIDAALSAGYGMEVVGSKPTAVVEPLSTASILSVPAPTIYYERCGGYYWVLATWNFTSIPALKSDARSCSNCAVGPIDVFGLSLSRDVADPGGYSGSHWGASSVYPPAASNIGDASTHGVATEQQDRFCRGGTCSVDDYNMYHGQLIMSIDVPGCGPLTAITKYGHSWPTVVLNGVQIGTNSIGINWSNNTSAWNRAGAGFSNTIYGC